MPEQPYTICLATTPLRAADSAVRAVVDSLLAQLPRPDAIVLTVPRTITRPSMTPVHLASDALSWANHSRVHVRIIDEKDDFGPATKLLGCESPLRPSTGCMLVTDDDAPRPSWWARTLCTQLTSARKRGGMYVAGAVRASKVGNDPSLHVQGNRGYALRREDVDIDEMRRFATRLSLIHI